MSVVAGAPVRVDLASWPGVVLTVDADGMIVDANACAESLFGDPLVGRAATDFIDPESSGAKWRRMLGRTVVDGPTRWELILRSCEGRLLDPRCFSVLRDGESGAVSLVEHPANPRVESLTQEVEAVNADLTTAQRRLVQEQARLAAALRELERSNAALDEFAHVVSHDLKAPLRAIADYAELLANDASLPLPAEPRSFLERINVLTMKMRAMVDGVLAYARAGRAADAVERMDTGAMVREVVDFLQPPPDVSVAIDGDLPVIETARVPLEQVFRNLISNAIKYRRADGATVRVSAADEGTCWRFAVTDNGPGVPPSQRDRMWGLFQTTRPSDGTGIGLALVKRLAEAQGGSVELDPEYTDGARFVVHWPKRHGRMEGRAS